MKLTYLFYYVLLLLFALGYSAPATAQIDARLVRYPDVSATQITFVYANDVWIVPKAGGLAQRLSSPPGEEMLPRFSPDGSRIAVSANYNGNTDIYVLPTLGGLPQRLTYHGMNDRMLDWYPDGRHVLFASSRYSGKQRFSQFFKVPVTGGMPERLPVPYGEFASLSPDAERVVYTTKSRLFRTWKRYRGGMAPDIYLFDLNDLSSRKLIASPANEELPMWQGDRIYYLSDDNPAQRYNLYVYDMTTEERKQLTDFTDFDVHFPAIGPEEIVFTAGGQLYLLNLASEDFRAVAIDVVSDRAKLAPRIVNAADQLQSVTLSPAAKRLVVEARGELISVPAKEGFVENLTQSSGSAQRYPAYAPDGEHLAYWSDASGEYNLQLMNLETGATEQLTNFDRGFGYHLFWSPDGKKIGFINQAMEIQYYDRDRGTVVSIDKGRDFFEGGLRSFRMSWSPDSRYVSYSRSVGNDNAAIFIYDTQAKQRRQVTSGFYSDYQPVFGPEGKYLYLNTDRNFAPVYSDFNNDWTYPNATHLALITLQQATDSPLAPRNDSDADAAEEKDKKEEKKETEPDSEPESVMIDWDNFEQRLIVLPITPGNFGRIAATEDKLLYLQRPRTGSEDEESQLHYYDFKEREEKRILDPVDDFHLAANGESILVRQGKKFGVIKVAADQKLEDPAPVAKLEMTLVPREEWRQIFSDAWRFERDYFYDPNLHGVDWAGMRKRYGALIEQAGSREDVNFILGELIGELNASHTYRGGGDTEDANDRAVGYLGVDWTVAKDKYRIENIVTGADWDSEVRSPLTAPGVDLREGDYLLAVNGRPVAIDRSVYAAFDGLAGTTVQLTLERDGEPFTEIVETLRDETRLRNLAWIENNRRRVEELSDGRIGYVYVPSTGIDGQNELVRMFYGQWNKEGLIIDERFNNGGQIPDRFIELLDREPLAFWAVRDGATWQWPPRSHFGPKAMLINGWSGSGGDAFPDYFRKAELGPLVGERTWGGLIGISGTPTLIDGGSVSVPTFRMYDPEGEWFREGYGVDPDVEVADDPTVMAKGGDAQLERAVRLILEELRQNPTPDFAEPEPEVRAGSNRR